MKILLLNGSPNKTGQTMTLAAMLTEKLDGEIKTVHTYDADVAACFDCKYCFENPGCAVKDEMQDIYKLIDWAELFLIASPVHFGIISAKLMTLASRVQTFWAAANVRKDMEKPAKIKGGVNIFTAGAKWNNMFLPCEGVSSLLFHSLGAEQIGSLYAAGTDALPVEQSSEAKRKAELTADRIKLFFNL